MHQPVLAVDPRNSSIAIGDEQSVQIISVNALLAAPPVPSLSAAPPSLKRFSAAACRTACQFALPCRALAFAPSTASAAGGASAAVLLAAAGDPENVKLVDWRRGAVRRQLRNDAGYFLDLAWDPEGEFLAAAQREGYVCVYRLSDGERVCRTRFFKRIPVVSSRRRTMSWQPDGALLAVPGEEGEVFLVERLSWETAAELAGGEHLAPVILTAFSPNGLYLASADEQNRIVIWETQRGYAVSAATVKSGSSLPSSTHIPSPSSSLPLDNDKCCLSSLAWDPCSNALVVTGECGGVTVWKKPVPEQGIREDPKDPKSRILDLAPPHVMSEELTKAQLAAEAAADQQKGPGGAARGDLNPRDAGMEEEGLEEKEELTKAQLAAEAAADQQKGPGGAARGDLNPRDAGMEEEGLEEKEELTKAQLA
eukprot:CAMPEP_0175048066 /NCGR_PEP_ID=MMETSP0052_2-20121109/5961_1 /TAXON_ID=51329 ORGANISM="Polytomella parva, Strain SAG 63-3" /NCGR_SAMPLE_ID=MMETSP0052_2 /ASSEMBLY_ACC=CAM_ASM_000194 /LENGTH=423 /DNA_ID=CAMNT_0016312045 /DNA_START=129 /DNA_END=1397 /DNA_ORIENTATION=-